MELKKLSDNTLRSLNKRTIYSNHWKRVSLGPSVDPSETLEYNNGRIYTRDELSVQTDYPSDG